MKKLITLVLLTTLIVSIVTTVFAEPEKAMTVFVRGKKVITDAEPYIENGIVMVPFRAIVETMGAEVEWIEEYGRVEAGLASPGYISLKIGETKYEVHSEIPNDCVAEAEPVLRNERTYVPVSFFRDSLNAEVRYIPGYNAVTIDYETVFEKKLSKETLMDCGVKVSLPDNAIVWEDTAYAQGFFGCDLRSMWIYRREEKSAGDFLKDIENQGVNQAGDIFRFGDNEAVRIEPYETTIEEAYYDYLKEDSNSLFVSSGDIYYLVKDSNGNLYIFTFNIIVDEYIKFNSEYLDLFMRIIKTLEVVE